MLYTNATSLANKWDEFNALLDVCKFPEILMITETWFNENSLKIISNYDLFNKDRVQVIGGGVAIYVRKDLNAYEVDDFGLVNSNCEQVWCKILAGNEVLLIGCIYRPPYSSKEINDEIMYAIKKAKDSVNKGKYTKLLIAGDFNFPRIIWKDWFGCIEGNGKGNGGGISSKFLETLGDGFLYQHVHEPTFGDSTLDLVITNDCEGVHSLKICPHLGFSQKNRLHSVIRWELELNNGVKPRRIDRILYSKGNYDGFSRHLDSFVFKDCESDVNEAYEKFLESYSNGLREFIPVSSSSSASIATRSNPKWFNSDIKSLTKLKYELFLKVRLARKDVSLKAKYREVCKLVKKTVIKARVCFEENIAKMSKKNPKIIYSYINSQRKCHEKIRSLSNDDGNLVVDRVEITNILNRQFQSAFSSDEGAQYPVFEPRCTTKCVVDIEVFSSMNIIKILDKINKRKSQGPDGVNPYVIGSCSSSMAKHLEFIFKSSFDQGQVPLRWKEANVSPLFKKGKLL